jgi:large subunit ribosomal protein L25
MAAPDTYSVSPRSVTGKRVAGLRRAGLLPANIYGRGIESVAVEMPSRAARDMLIAHGTDTLIQLNVEGESATRPVVVRTYQRHPVTREVLHLDFYQVDLKRAIQAAVPIHITGEAPAVHTYQGILLAGADSIQIEALPTDLPDFLEVSIEGLAELDTQVTVADLVAPAGVRILTDPDTVLARVTRPRVATEAEALAEGEQAPEEAAAEGEEGAEASAESEAEATAEE